MEASSLGPGVCSCSPRRRSTSRRRCPTMPSTSGRFWTTPAWADDTAWTPPDGDGPLVLVAMSSTFQDDVDCLQRITDALGTLPVRGLVTTGPAIAADAIRAPANVTLVASAPHREVMRQADLVVTHGGHGTVIKTLAAGLPLVILHHGRDQADNAVRVTTRGAGIAALAPRTGGEDRAGHRRGSRRPRLPSGCGKARRGRGIRRHRHRARSTSRAGAGQPNVKQYTSTPAAPNSISNPRVVTGPTGGSAGTWCCSETTPRPSASTSMPWAPARDGRRGRPGTGSRCPRPAP